ncbi:MAG TPA: sugar ABC transporter substrate-binding protein [Candidatus Acidoferrum sp.]|jgi:ribose transport system substrate-binding protein|nr:sugar ABC transporter substrate-binding protein [Candidatus Acidoferrum sp.]
MKRIRLLISLMTRENDYQLEQAASAQESAKSLGIDAQIIFADNDAITQGTQILKIIQADPATRPDAIVCEPVGGPCLPQVARAAVQAGIPWVLLNREADYIPELRRNAPRLAIFSIGSDQKEVGRIQGLQLASLVRNGGGVLHIQGPSENVTAKDRTTGMQATLPPHIPVTTLRGQWTEESAQRSVESWLRLNTSQKMTISAVAGQNDAMAMGARKAFSGIDNNTDRDRWMRLPFLGCDGVTKTGQAWVRTKMLAATVVIPTTAGRAISILHQALLTDLRPPERTSTTPESFPPVAQLN